MKFKNQAELDAYIQAEVDKGTDEAVKAAIEAEKKTAPAPTEAPAREARYEVGDDLLSKDPKGGFVNMGEFAQAVAKGSQKGVRVLPEKLDKWANACKTLQTNVADDGGYLIPTQFSTQLFNMTAEQNLFLSRATVIPMQSNSLDLPIPDDSDQSGGYSFGGVKFYWIEESKQGSFTSPKTKVLSLKLKKLMALCKVTSEMLEDSPISIEPILNTAFTSGLNFEINKACLSGTGAGEPLGILNSNGHVTVAKETAQPADTILYENIVKMYGRLWDDDENSVAGALWVANKDTLKELALMSYAIGTNGIAVWMPPGGASQAPYGTLFGIPMMFNKHCETLGDEGDINLFNLKYYIIGTKGGLTNASSQHLYFDYDAWAFRWTFRMDGRPMWNDVVKGPKSADSMSPFVNLAVRA